MFELVHFSLQSLNAMPMSLYYPPVRIMCYLLFWLVRRSDTRLIYVSWPSLEHTAMLSRTWMMVMMETNSVKRNTSTHLCHWKADQIFLELFHKFIFFSPFENFPQDAKPRVWRRLSIDKARQEDQNGEITPVVMCTCNGNFHRSLLATFSSPVWISPGRIRVREYFDNQRG